MKLFLSFLSLLLVFLLIPEVSLAKTSVFACEPEWAALSKEIGGDRVETFSATSASQDPHYIRARPSLVSKVRKADMLFCSGAGLEGGWLPILLKKSGAGLQPGSAGYLMAADAVKLLEVPLVVDRRMGDIHPQGNPHVHLNPYNLILVGRLLADRLSLLDPENASFYEGRYEDFASRLQKAISIWEKEAFLLKGKRVVVHHKSFAYLLDWLQMEKAATLEPKPGIPPTASHLKKLLRQLRSSPVDAIVRTPYEPDDAGEWLSEKTGTSAVVLPYTVGGDSKSSDLFALFERSVYLLKGTTQVAE